MIILSARWLRSLAHIYDVSERIMHGKWNFLLYGIDNSRGLKS